MPIHGSYELMVLFLSISDATRLKILNRLYEQTSLHDICDEFQLLVHEGIRQLRRLEDVGLVSRSPTGDYMLSNFGLTIMPFLEGISNLYGFLEYWEAHSTSELPPHLKFMSAELYEFFIDNSATLADVSLKIINSADKFLWILNEDIRTESLKAKDVRILASNSSNSKYERSRYVHDVYTQLVINEHQAKISFPGITADRKRYRESNTGFLLTSPSGIYYLLMDYFNFLWSAKSSKVPIH